MSTTTYRNDLAAAHMRTNALEVELKAAQSRIQSLEGETVDEDAPLHRLLAKGQRESKRQSDLAKRALSRKQQHEARRDERTRKWNRWTARSTQRRSMFGYPLLGRWLLPVAVVGALSPFIAIFIIFASARLMLAYLMVGLGAANLVAAAWGWWAIYREQTRLLSLPFPVSGHMRALGASDLRKPELRIKFRDKAPSQMEANALLLGLIQDTKNPFTAMSLRKSGVVSAGDSLVFKGGNVEHSWHTDNRGYLLWYRKLVQTAAVALHEAYPVSSVSIEQ